MKKYVLISAATALVVTTAIFLTLSYFGYFNSKTVQIEHVPFNPVRGAMFTYNADGEIVPLDFTMTAEKVTNAVVHITSTQTEVVRGPSQRSPFDDFFQDDFFERFFGPQFRTPERQPQPRARTGSGSGVIIAPDGYIVTNNHVIANADDIEVTLNNNRSYKATLIGADPTTDLALLQIKEDNLPTLTFTDSDRVRVGEWVMAVGNPFNLNSTVTAGIVSAKARSIQILREQFAIESFIQTDAAINPGNSGGALVNLEGQLIGINTAIASPTGSYSGYGFAVPSNIVKKVVEDLLEYGQVQRGFIGAMIRSVDQSLANEKDLRIVRGVYIDSLVAGGSAEKAGLKIGDVVVAIQGVEVNTSSEMLEIIGRHRPGDKLKFTVDRKGKRMDLDIVLKNQDGGTERVREEVSSLRDLLGADFVSLPAKKASELEITGGVEVKKLYPGKLRRETNIREGFIITSVNGKSVRSTADLEKILGGHEGGVMLEGVYPGQNKPIYYAFGM